MYGYEIMEAMGKTPYPWMLGKSPYPLTDPVKILGNVSAAALIIGITLVMMNRSRNKEKAGSGGYYDWLFISIVSAIAVTGILSEILRLANIAILAYTIYFFHLVVVFLPVRLCSFFKNGTHGLQSNSNGFCKVFREGNLAC